mgnify:CR=1 FL=1
MEFFHSSCPRILPSWLASPKFFQSWILDELTCIWKAPIDYPNTGLDYRWDDNLVSWIEIKEEDNLDQEENNINSDDPDHIQTIEKI